jgi:hypothetical protein
MRRQLTPAMAVFVTMALAVTAMFAVRTAGAVGNPVIYNDWQSGNAAAECARIGDYDGAYKVDAAAPNGTYSVDAYGNEITISGSNGMVFNWSSNFGIGAVIVKAGPGANVWFYDPQVMSDTGLYGFDNKEISHVTFCWQYQLDVSKTADTTFTRDFDWIIEKSADQTELTLSQGQQHDVTYTVKVTKDGGTDSAWAVTGDIFIENNTPVAFTVTDVGDVISGGIDATVTCALPKPLASGESLTCTYSASLPNGDDRVNTATVTYHKTVGNDRTAMATADVLFGDPTTLEDNCVDISDSYAGNLGTLCESGEFSYTRTIDADDLECGLNTIDNIAYLDSDDGVVEEASETVTVDVACAAGCTLTQGYWKTHSEFGPAPYDATWAQLPAGASTMFFDTGKTWYKVFWTAPAGNAYYNLAHQYMAAKLNQLNGASVPPEVQTALDSAAALLAYYDGNPKPMSDIKGSVRSQFLSLASTLDKYNNGLIGPGHCSE